LTGDEIAVVSGTVSAPSGTIVLGGGTFDPIGTGQGPAALNGEGVWLASGGQLLATGTEVATPSGRLLLGDVLPGGQVTISGGNIILAPGSIIDVSEPPVSPASRLSVREQSLCLRFSFRRAKHMPPRAQAARFQSRPRWVLFSKARLRGQAVAVMLPEER
jgi:hypothetical protein